MTPYITSAERFGREEGLKEGLKEGRKEGIERGLDIVRDLVLETLEDRFGKVPKRIFEELRTVEDADRLKKLQHQAIKCSHLEDFSIVEAPSS